MARAREDFGRFARRYGPWAVIAGAGEGLGAAYAEALAGRGLSVLLIDERTDLLQALDARLRSQHGVAVEALVLDLGGADCDERIAGVSAGKDVGLLIYNAAASAMGDYLDSEAATLERTLAVNCLAPSLLAHRFGRRFRERGRGGIILMSSLSALQGNPLLAQYAATKAYNLILAEGLWEECRGHGVDVLACAPGATLTPAYRALRGALPRSSFPPEMTPAAVVEETLAALGRGPTVIPGWANRLSAALMRRVLPRRQAIELMGRIARKLKQPAS